MSDLDRDGTVGAWEHAVPYLGPSSAIGPRISIQWRFARRTGRPFHGASCRAPLHRKR